MRRFQYSTDNMVLSLYIVRAEERRRSSNGEGVPKLCQDDLAVIPVFDPAKGNPLFVPMFKSLCAYFLRESVSKWLFGVSTKHPRSPSVHVEATSLFCLWWTWRTRLVVAHFEGSPHREGREIHAIRHVGFFYI